MKRRLRPWMVVLVLGLAYVGLTLARHGGDPLAFAMVGTRYSQGLPEGTPGYDGQFAYFIARDLLHGWRHCDVPAYRYQRILYPLLAWALALGRSRLVPWTLIALNLAALVGGTYFTERLLAKRAASRWYALAYGLYGGLVSGLRLDLNEPLAYGLVQGALWAWEIRPQASSIKHQASSIQHPASSIKHQASSIQYPASSIQYPASSIKPRVSRFVPHALLALAALAKETALIAAGGLLLHLALERCWREAAALGLAVGLPFLAWQGILWAWLGTPGLGSGGAMATPFEWVPFAGLLRTATVSRSAFWLLLAIEGPLFVLPTVWALFASLRDVVSGRRHPWVTILLAQAVVLPFLPFSTWREPLAMARLATGLVAATLLYGALSLSRRPLRYSLFWLSTLALLVSESQLPV